MDALKHFHASHVCELFWWLLPSEPGLSPNYLSNPKPGHTTGGAVRAGAWRGGGAGRVGAGQGAGDSVRLGNNGPSYFRGSTTNCPGRLFRRTDKRNLI